MTRFHKGILLAVFQIALLLMVAGKYYLDRQNLPRVWAQTTPFDPNLPVRGRYVRLQVLVDSSETSSAWLGQLSIRNGRLVAAGAGHPEGVRIVRMRDGRAALAEPVAFFIPEHIPDPSRRAPGEELWVELSLPPTGAPRPVRLGVKKDGVLTPLNID